MLPYWLGRCIRHLCIKRFRHAFPAPYFVRSDRPSNLELMFQGSHQEPGGERCGTSAFLIRALGTTEYRKIYRI